MKIINFLDNAVEAWAWSMHLWAAENRSKVSAIEAMEQMARNRKGFANVTPRAAMEAQEMAIMLVHAAVSEEELEGLIKRHIQEKSEEVE